MDFKSCIGTIPDFPKPGILFYDVGTLLANGPAWREAVDALAKTVSDLKPDVLIGIESRGFLVAAPLAAQLGIGFVMARKQGKLPGTTIAHAYELEYGNAVLELQENAIKPGQRVVILDDLLATGGTAAATIELARKCGANVCAAAFLIELSFLKGRGKLDVPVTSLVSYAS